MRAFPTRSGERGGFGSIKGSVRSRGKAKGGMFVVRNRRVPPGAAMSAGGGTGGDRLDGIVVKCRWMISGPGNKGTSMGISLCTVAGNSAGEGPNLQLSRVTSPLSVRTAGGLQEEQMPLLPCPVWGAEQ